MAYIVLIYDWTLWQTDKETEWEETLEGERLI